MQQQLTRPCAKCVHARFTQSPKLRNADASLRSVRSRSRHQNTLPRNNDIHPRSGTLFCGRSNWSDLARCVRLLDSPKARNSGTRTQVFEASALVTGIRRLWPATLTFTPDLVHSSAPRQLERPCAMCGLLATPKARNSGTRTQVFEASALATGIRRLRPGGGIQERRRLHNG